MKIKNKKGLLFGLGSVLIIFSALMLTNNTDLFQGNMFLINDYQNRESVNLTEINNDRSINLNEFNSNREKDSDLSNIYKWIEENREMVESFDRGNENIEGRNNEDSDRNRSYQDYLSGSEAHRLYEDIIRLADEGNVEVAREYMQKFEQNFKTLNSNNNAGYVITPPTPSEKNPQPANTQLGDVLFEQNGAGTVLINGPTSKTMSSSVTSNSYKGQVGDYTLDITPPTGYEVAKVVNWDLGLNRPLSVPYTQSLTANNRITYLVEYDGPCINLSRAKLIKDLIIRVNGLNNYIKPTTNSFSDVKSNEWWYEYIEAGVQLGWFSPGGSFRPTDFINRAEAAKYAAVAYGSLNAYIKPNQPTFADISDGAWYYNYVEAIFQDGLILKNKANFEPSNLANSCMLQQKVYTSQGSILYSNGNQVSKLMPTVNDDLYNFTITAKNGDVKFNSLAFKLKTKGFGFPAPKDIFDFKIKNSSGVIANASISGYGFNGGGVLSGTNSGSGLAAFDSNSLNAIQDGDYVVTVSFPNTELIKNGATESYSLRASISGAKTDDTLQLSLDLIDQFKPTNVSVFNYQK